SQAYGNACFSTHDIWKSIESSELVSGNKKAGLWPVFNGWYPLFLISRLNPLEDVIAGLRPLCGADCTELACSLQTDDEFHPQAFVVRDEAELTATALCDRLDDGQPQPTAVAFAASPEALSETLDPFRRDAWPVVLHGEADFMLAVLLQPQADDGAVSRMATRIVQEVTQCCDGQGRRHCQ